MSNENSYANMSLPKVGQNGRFEHLDPETSGLLSIIVNLSPESFRDISKSQSLTSP